MLEQSCLDIAPWRDEASGGSPSRWVRHITDGAGRHVGFVHLERGTKPRWFFWLRRLRLEVYETEDASHVMTLMRGWRLRRIWDVFDADERWVGRIAPPHLLDYDRALRGRIGPTHGQPGEIVDPNGRGLASYRKIAAGHLLATFLPQDEVNPFLRMLLVGSLLTLDVLPS